MRGSVLPHLIIINSLIWLAGIRFEELALTLAIHKWGYEFEPWQVITYFFTHRSFWHILANMIALWSLGSAVEPVMGSSNFLFMYLFVGIASGVCLAFLDPSPFPVLGASTSVSGVLAAYAYLFPRSQLVIFPLPIPFSARWLAIGFGVISLLLFLWEPVMGGISHFGHLCGLVFGWVYLRWIWKWWHI
ncbi:MAG: rhomboid family intramembrane serine protease [Bacteroidia bacterium]|nr:rhomboid family intramembrane serine protease [Bacteroidia bacterium]MCX7764937.1 rhomboid family intramembrane serine protease [Bacteroidia bacterium]MDW8057750.1 rhomboid family intramembrane serine protease [Bacteroidia bacterium]